MSEHITATTEAAPSVDLPESEYRAAQVGQYVAESTGDVGIITSFANIPAEVQNNVVDTLAQRRNDTNNKPFDRKRSQGDDYPGITNLGDREIGVEGDTGHIPLSGGKGAEVVNFTPNGKGGVEVRYGFSGRGYLDGTGRPNTLEVGFALSEKSAARLRENIAGDPTFMRDVVKGQVLALGISEKYYDSMLAPRGTHNDIHEGTGALTVRESDAQGNAVSETSVGFVGRDSIKPAADIEAARNPYELPEAAPVQPVAETTARAQAETSSAADRKQRLAERIKLMETDGRTPAEIIVDLTDEYNDANRVADGDTEPTETYSVEDAIEDGHNLWSALQEYVAGQTAGKSAQKQQDFMDGVLRQSAEEYVESCGDDQVEPVRFDNNTTGHYDSGSMTDLAANLDTLRMLFADNRYIGEDLDAVTARVNEQIGHAIAVGKIAQMVMRG